MAANLQEVHYRLRSDTGTVDASPTWIAAEDTAGTVTPGTPFRIRTVIQNTGTVSANVREIGNDAFIVRCGSPAGIGNDFAALFAGSASASSSADATAVTVQRETAGTGSFVNGVYDSNLSLISALANGNYSEYEAGVVLTSPAGVGGGETWTCRWGNMNSASSHTITFTTADTNGTNFSHGAQLGSASQKVANSASISMTTAAAASSGNLVVVHVACDNNASTDGDKSEISGVTIGGVAATKAVEFTNSNGSAQAGCTSSLWYLQLASNLASGSTITATFTTAATSGDANVIQAREYVVTSGFTVSVEATNSAATDTAAAPASLNATTSNIECLRICAHATDKSSGQATAGDFAEPKTTSKDWSFWWTSGHIYPSTGSSGTDAGSLVEANISTGTGAASTVTLAGGSTNRNWASVYAAFKATFSSFSYYKEWEYPTALRKTEMIGY